MYGDSAMIILFNTLTSTHPGSGTELSYIDMPIQREGYTGYPKIEASTLKGCIRHAFTERCENEKGEEKESIDRIFGKAEQGEFASAVSITDARILFFPVKSAKGVLAWITCPTVLKRFYGDYGLAFGKNFPKPVYINELDNKVYADAIIAENEGGTLSQEINGKNVIMLEEYTFHVKYNHEFKELVQLVGEHMPKSGIVKDMLLERAVMLSDDDFSDFIKYSTEVSTRIKISADTGTAEGKGLFTEEYLPPECVLYSLAFFSDSHQSQKETGSEGRWDAGKVKGEFSRLFSEKMIQVGADKTLGKGFVGVEFWEGKEDA